METYEEEVRQKPRGVVAAIGMKSISFDVFQALSKSCVDPAKPAEKLPSLRVIPMDYGETTPSRKDHLPKPENYVPGGILKSNWMKNHTSVHPSVVALVISWAETPNPNWKVKEAEVLELIEKTKGGMRSKNVRLLVVLLIKSGVDAEGVAEERMSSLRRVSGLSERNFVYFNREEIVNSTSRMENVLSEFSDAYYKDESRLIMKEKELKNSKAQPILLVRNNFKVAFFSEFRAEWNSAVSHYTLAHNHLQDCVNTQNLNEVKTLADIINFKLCKIYFQGVHLGKAMGQFQGHMRMWKSYVGSARTNFRHWGWVSRQYQAFGELTEVYVDPAKVTELGQTHSGFFFQAAASYAIKQKERYVATLNSFSNHDLLEKIKEKAAKDSSSTPPPYLGQISLILGEGSGGMGGGEVAVANALVKEGKEGHSAHIIALLTRAYDQFSKRKKTSRMLLYLASQIAQEYHHTKHYTHAKDLFIRIAKNYSREGWDVLLQSILTTVLDCARHEGKTEDYIQHVVEIMGLSTTSSKEKCQMQEHLITSLLRPDEYGLKPLEKEVKIAVPQNDKGDKGVIFVYLQFLNPEVYAHTDVTCVVKVVSKFPLPIRFSRLRLVFNEQEYNQKLFDNGPLVFSSPEEMRDDSIRSGWEKESLEAENLFLMPGQSKTYNFTFTIPQLAALDCHSVELHLGTGPSAVIFEWDYSEWKPEYFHPRYKRFAEEFKRGGFVQRPKVVIQKPKPKLSLDVSHDPPALSREFYEIGVQITNEEDKIVSGLLKFDVQSSLSQLTGFYATDKQTILKEIEVGEIAAGETKTFLLYALSSGPNPDRSILFSFAYDTEKYHTSLEKQILSPVQDPFVITWDAFLPSFQSLEDFSSSSVSLSSPFFMCLELECNTPFPIKLKRVELELEQEDAVSYTTTAVQFDTADASDINQTRREKQRKMPLPRARSCLKNHQQDQEVDVATLFSLSLQDEEEGQPPVDAAALLNTTNAIVVTRGSRYTVWYCIKPMITGENINIGRVVVGWERTSSVFTKKEQTEFDVSSLIASSNSLPLYVPPIQVTSAPFLTKTRVPPEGMLGSPLTYVVEVTNLTCYVLEFSYRVKENDAFLISGLKRANFKVLPFATHITQSLLIPISTGMHSLPLCSVQSRKYPNSEGVQETKSVLICPVSSPSLSPSPSLL